jgi:DNA-binding transcriptional LysR family regulator
MELGELKVFLMVAAERSFSRAAAKLYRTQPAVSQAVRRLEDQLGERLFDRTTKHATLTDAGEVLLREGTRLVRLAEEATAAVRRESERGRAILRLAGSEVAAHALLPAMSAFLRQRDGIRVEFHPVAESDVVAQVTAGAFDIGVVVQERVPTQLLQLRVAVQPSGFSVVVPPGHRLATRSSAALTELHQERLVVMADRDISESLAAAFTVASVKQAFEIAMPGIDSLKRAVEMGLGVGVIPSSVASATGALVVVPLACTSFRSAVTIVCRRSESVSRHVARFIEVVRASHQSIVKDLRSHETGRRRRPDALTGAGEAFRPARGAASA